MKKFTLLLFAFILGQVINAQMLWKKDAQTTATASENQASVDSLFDNDVNSIWSATGSGEIVFKNLANDFVYTGYVIYAADANIPASWKFYGSSDGVDYTELDAQTGVSLTARRRTRFHNDNTTNYSYYKIEFFDTEGYVNSGGAIDVAGFLFETNGKTESFELIEMTTETRLTGSYTGDNSIEWSYVDARRGYWTEEDANQYFQMEEKGIMLRGNNTGYITATVPNGVSKMSIEYVNAFNSAGSNNTEAYLKFFLTELGSGGAETEVAITPTVGPAVVIGSEGVENLSSTGVQTFCIDGLDYSGNVQIKIQAFERPIVIDNIGYFANPLTTGVDDIKVPNFKAYPNPSRDAWTLNSENEIIRSVDLYSVLGNRVITMMPNSKTTKIDASSLANGIYLAKVNTQNGSTTLRLIKK